MHEQTDLRDRIIALGARLVSDDHNVDDDGSIISTFEGSGGHPFRLAWVGRDGYAVLQVPRNAEEWKEVGPIVLDGMAAGSPELDEMIEIAQSLIADETQ